MTGEDHNTDALIAALRSPANSAEQVGEAAAVTAMLEVLPTLVPARTSVLRSRRGIAIAAVTVASLGVGGLVAAGPGIFQAAADRPTAAPLSTIASVSNADDEDDPGGDDDADDGRDDTDPVSAARPTSPASSDVECVGNTHGDTVSSIAKAIDPGPEHGPTIRDAARPGCDEHDDDDTDPDVECVGETHGEIVSGVAHEARAALEPGSDDGSGIGRTVAGAARSDCGTNDSGQADDVAGRSGGAPGRTGAAPGLSRDLPAVTAPARPPDTPRTTTP